MHFKWTTARATRILNAIPTDMNSAKMDCLLSSLSCSNGLKSGIDFFTAFSSQLLFLFIQQMATTTSAITATPTHVIEALLAAVLFATCAAVWIGSIFVFSFIACYVAIVSNPLGFGN